MKCNQFLANFSFIIFLVLSTCNAFAFSCSMLQENGPHGLTVEFIREPQGAVVVDLNPEFGWIVPEDAIYQSAYQILVASGSDKLEKNLGDVWDSGLVAGSNSTNVEYGGKALEPDNEYFWKVRIRNWEGRLLDYSSPQKFKTGKTGEFITTPNWFHVERLSPVHFEMKTDGSFLYDFGRAAFGTLELSYKADARQKLFIHLGEKLKDGRIDREPGGTIRYQKVVMEVVPGREHYQVELVPDKRNTNEMALAMPDSFPVIMPFRYVEIETDAGNKLDIKPEHINRVEYYNYFDDEASSFHSSDTILNQVWNLCKYSIKATTFAGLYVDGDRERIPYEADAYLNQLSHYGVDNEYAIARRTIEYFMDNPTWPTEWQLHVALMFYQDYMYTGNTELIEKYYDALKHKTLMALETEDGFISVESPGHTGELMKNLGFADATQRLRDIVDWPQKGGFGGVMGEDDGFVFRPVNTVINAMYYGNMVIMARLAKVMGKTTDEDDFNYRAARVRKAINEQLYNSEGGYYTDGLGTQHGSVHASMFPLAFGIVSDANIRSVVEHIKTRGMACSVYGAQYLMEAVYIAGAGDYALELMTATHDRSWYNMIKSGSTITMEAWDMKYKPNSDWNHAWGAVPANIIPRHLWGITPGTPGFGVVSIQPQMGNLKKSSIKVPTIRGSIRGEYQITGEGNQKFVFILPANMSGEFKMEFSPYQVVTINGNPVRKQHHAIQLNPGRNELDIIEGNLDTDG